MIFFSLSGDVSKPNMFASSIAFSAHRTNNIDPQSQPEIIKFDQIDVNNGNGFNPSLGIFTATVGGTYFFSCHTRSSANTASAVIVKYGSDTVAAMLFGNAGFFMSSNSFMLQLTIGDRVWMELQTGYAINNDGYRYTSFSGFLLNQ